MKEMRDIGAFSSPENGGGQGRDRSRRAGNPFSSPLDRAGRLPPQRLKIPPRGRLVVHRAPVEGLVQDLGQYAGVIVDVMNPT